MVGVVFVFRHQLFFSARVFLTLYACVNKMKGLETVDYSVYFT